MWHVGSVTVGVVCGTALWSAMGSGEVVTVCGHLVLVTSVSLACVHCLIHGGSQCVSVSV